MIFRNPHKIINYNLKIKIDGKIIIPSHKIKYLGIILDPHLNPTKGGLFWVVSKVGVGQFDPPPLI